MVWDYHSSCDTASFPGVLCRPTDEHRQEGQQRPASNIVH